MAKELRHLSPQMEKAGAMRPPTVETIIVLSTLGDNQTMDL